ncbi:hypothetical protein SAMN03080615_02969 [Amphritea atlantica]|uniref:Uncharacterized protein n=1 Tax=Amphritea atlantica TaxID=355243 RepID=A0A1H9JFI8_9GAMM|nr:hypothetical protein [Amphritea atlantica]SEQ85548.1 hypothetical protein SAMN03080615_02969 [Amphritea atlantica]
MLCIDETVVNRTADASGCIVQSPGTKQHLLVFGQAVLNIDDRIMNLEVEIVLTGFFCVGGCLMPDDKVDDQQNKRDQSWQASNQF